MSRCNHGNRTEKCEFCGTLYNEKADGTLFHGAGAECPLSHCLFYYMQVDAINLAIIQSRTLPVKPEDCARFTPKSQNGFIVCEVRNVGVPRACCPCSNFTKKISDLCSSC